MVYLGDAWQGHADDGENGASVLHQSREVSLGIPVWKIGMEGFWFPSSRIEVTILDLLRDSRHHCRRRGGFLRGRNVQLLHRVIPGGSFEHCHKRLGPENCGGGGPELRPLELRALRFLGGSCHSSGPASC